MNNLFSIILSTYDENIRILPSFFKLLKKYWPECDAEIISMAANADYFDSKFGLIESLHCSETTPWSEKLSLALKKCKTPIFLFFLDDYFLKKRVDNEVFNNYLSLIYGNNHIASMTFAWMPSCSKKDSIGFFEKRKWISRYRINAFIGLWRKQYVLSVIKIGENAWNYEICGTFRSFFLRGKHYSLKRENCPFVFYYDWGRLLAKGNYNIELADYFKKEEGIDLASLNYKPETKKERKHKPFITYLFISFVSLFRRGVKIEKN